MNKLIFALLLILSGQCFAQTFRSQHEIFIDGKWAEVLPVTMPATISGLQLNTWPDCGTPIPYEEISDWKTVDTLGDFCSRKVDYSFLAKNLYEWVDDEWNADRSGWFTAEYRSPCFPKPTTYTQYRIHKVTGIRQMRTKVKGTRYEPKPKSEYEKTVEALTKKSNP